MPNLGLVYVSNTHSTYVFLDFDIVYTHGRWHNYNISGPQTRQKVSDSVNVIVLVRRLHINWTDRRQHDQLFRNDHTLDIAYRLLLLPFDIVRRN